MSGLKNWVNEVLSGVGLALGVDLITTKELLGIILIALNIGVLVISTIMKVISWYKKAKEDGKITKEEVDELTEIINDTKTQIENEVKENEKDGQN